MVAEIKTNQRRKELGLPTQERARHMVFVGKPGTAKTTIAPRRCSHRTGSTSAATTCATCAATARTS